MPTYDADLKQVQELNKKAASANKKAAGYTSDASIFKDLVMNDVQKARAERGISQIAKDSGVAMSQLVTGGQEIRDRADGIVDPTTVDRLTSAQRGQTLGTIATIGQTLKERAGTIEDVIGQGTNRLTAIAGMLQAQAQNYAEQASRVMEIVKVKQSQEAQDFQQWLAKENLTLDQQKFAFQKANSGGSGGSGGSGMVLSDGTKISEKELNEMREGLSAAYIDNSIDPDLALNALRIQYGDKLQFVPGYQQVLEKSRAVKFGRAAQIPPKTASTPGFQEGLSNFAINGIGGTFSNWSGNSDPSLRVGYNPNPNALKGITIK